MSSKKSQKKGTNYDYDKQERDLLETMPLSGAIRKHEKGMIGECLVPFLGENVTVIEAKQTIGERFTGGRSTPVFELEVSRSNDEVDRLVLKLIIQTCPSDPIQRTSYAMRVRSYEVEAGFYGKNHGDDTNEACPARALRRLHMHLPTCLCVERGGAHAKSLSPPQPNDAALSFLMTDLRATHPLHPESLSLQQTRASLDWLASMHARFWEAPRCMNEWAGTQLWECGSFWAVKHRLDRLNNVDCRVETSWINTVRWLQKKAPPVAQIPSVQLLGRRIDACRSALHRALHGEVGAVNLAPVVYQKPPSSTRRKSRHSHSSHRRHRTLLHGDFKAANMFFAPEGETLDSCAVCDFQFAGPGFGAVDVCYLLFPDARADYSADELSLLDWYHQRLGEHLAKFDKGECFEGYSRTMLEWHYRLAQVDFLAYCVGSGWVASSARDVALVVRVEETMQSLDSGKILDEEGYEPAIEAKMAEL